MKIFICQYCKKEFKASFSRNRNRKYCSASCYKQVQISPMTNKKHTIEAIQKIKEARAKQIMGRGENSSAWKGNNVGIQGLHWRLRDRLGLASKCANENCKQRSQNFEWANISHKYKIDFKDFIQLCISCHRSYDKTYRNLERLFYRYLTVSL